MLTPTASLAKQGFIQARHASAAGSVALAVTLNLVALGLAGQTLLQQVPVTTPLTPSPRRDIVVLLEPSANPRHAAAAVMDPVITDMHTAEHGEKVAPAMNQRAGAAALAKATALATESAHPVRFYRFHEVDRAAEPETGWAVDLATLDSLGLERLAFEVFVNDAGEVVGCTVLEPPGLPEDLKHELVLHVRETKLVPAVRAGQVVASVRRIELFVSASSSAI